MSLTKKIAHNTLIQITGKIISTILGLLVIGLITRYLGQNGFGEYTTIITFITFFAIAADFGLTLVTVQMISGPQIKENKILNNLFSFRLVSILLVLILAPLTISFFPYNSAIKLGVMISFIAFLFPALNQIFIGLFQKKLNMSSDALAEMFGRIILLLGVMLTEKLRFGLNGVLISTVFAAAINFIFHYIFSLKFVKIKLEFDWTIWKEILNKSWPLAITIVLNLIYLRADILFLSLFGSNSQVGLYGASYKIIDILSTIPFMFAGLVLPILSTAWKKKKKDYFYKILQKSFDFMAILSVPLIVGAEFISRPIMNFVAGHDFLISGNILQILIFALMAIFLGTIFSHAVIAVNKQKTMIGFYIFTSLSSIIAYLIFIPKFSYFGAAGVTVYSETLIALFSAYTIWKYSKFRPNFKIFLKSLLSSLIMGFFLYFFRKTGQTTWSELLIIIIIASLIYFVSLFLFGGIKKEDIRTILGPKNENIGPTYSNLNL